MEIWRGYLEELLERYPLVRGIGGQFGEHSDQRCDCDVCSERYFDIQREFFEELVDTVQAKDPAIVPWIYDSWGSTEIVKAGDRFPNFLNIDWGAFDQAYKFQSRRQVPRSDWYFQNGLGGRWQESMVRLGTRVLSSYGVIGYQTRGGGYREQDEMYHALQEFTWNPSLEEDEFARLHVIRRYQRDDDALARLYGSWIKLNGYRRQLDNEADLAGWIDKNDVAAGLRSELAAFEESLSRADTGDDFVADMARDFESDRREWHAMGRPASGA